MRSAKVIRLGECNCSSTGHHTVMGKVETDSGGIVGFHYLIDDDAIIGARGWDVKPYARYIMNAIREGIAQAIEGGSLKVFEYDRDRNKRYTDLRYHPDHWEAVTVERLRQWIKER